MSKIVKIYHEGHTEGFDADILEKTLPLDAQRQPIGGKFSAKAVIQTHENVAPSKSDYWLFWRDRDFDKEPEFCKLLDFDAKGKICYSHRTTIENYLLDAEMFYQFCLQTSVSFVWKSKAKHEGLKEIEFVFKRQAEKIKSYQAVRYALSSIRNKTNLQITNSWSGGSGTLPKSLIDTDCKSEGSKILEAVFNSVKIYCSPPEFEEFQKKVTHYLAIFDQNFFDNFDFLVWFQGKDLMASLQRVEIFDEKKYYKFALKHFDYTRFPDLVALRYYIENKF